MSENEKKQTPAAAAADDENHIIAERRAKLAKLREEGVAYPNDFVRKDLFGDLRAEHGEKTREELDEAAIEVAVSGRMMLKRDGLGRLCHRTRLHGRNAVLRHAGRRRRRSLCTF